MNELIHTLGERELFSSTGSTIGPYHIQENLPNQDAYDLIATDDFLVLAVADGAGSLARSDEGSELAVEAGAGMAADLLLDHQRNSTTPNLEKVLAESILEARSAVFTLDYWREAGSTLVLAAVTKESFAVAALGDSFAVVQAMNGNLDLVQPPAAGEFANITKLITSSDPTVSICRGNTEDLRGLAVCSDAFEHSSLEQRVPTRGFWNTIFSMASKGSLSVKQLIDFMDSQGKIDDDATMVAVAITGSTLEDSQGVEFIHSEYNLQELKDLAEVKDLKATKPRGLPNNIILDF